MSMLARPRVNTHGELVWRCGTNAADELMKTTLTLHVAANEAHGMTVASWRSDL